MEAAFGEASEAHAVLCLASGTRAVCRPGGLVFQRVLYSSLLKPLLIFTDLYISHAENMFAEKRPSEMPAE